MTVLGPSRIIEIIYPKIKRYWVQLDIYAPFSYPICSADCLGQVELTSTLLVVSLRLNARSVN
jgi:hypothetical protein